MFSKSIANADRATLVKFFHCLDIEVQKTLNEILEKKPHYHYLLSSPQEDHYLNEKVLLQCLQESTIDAGIFKNLIPANIILESFGEDSSYTYRVVLFLLALQSIRLCALAHDMGHPPFSHLSELALQNIIKEVSEKDRAERTARERRLEEIFIKLYREMLESAPYVREEVQQKIDNGEDELRTLVHVFAANALHEQIGIHLFECMMERSVDSFEFLYDQNPHDVHSIIINQLFHIVVREFSLKISTNEKGVFESLHSLINGVIDGDRLDYVSRDPHNAGFDLGEVQSERIISHMRLIAVDEVFHFAPSIKTLNNIDDFFQKRWDQYTQMIWHHRVIKTDYLLQRAIELVGLKYLSSDEPADIYDDASLPFSIAGLWEAIDSIHSSETAACRIMQWDDSWMISVLKSIYFNEYYEANDSFTGNDFKIRNYLDEALAYSKHFFSISKRPVDFREIDEAVARYVKNHLAALQDVFTSRLESQNLEPQDLESQKDPVLSDILSDITENITLRIEQIEHGGASGLLNYIKDEIKLSEAETNFERIIMVAAESAAQELGLIDYLLVFKPRSMGIAKGKDFVLYRRTPAREAMPLDYQNVSTKVDELDSLNHQLPAFYMYIDNRKSVSREQIVEFKTKLGEEIGKGILNYYQVPIEQ
jgi:HD superfamily phosphohydrolase